MFVPWSGTNNRLPVFYFFITFKLKKMAKQTSHVKFFAFVGVPKKHHAVVVCCVMAS
jgi:hypothetical protein